jgi:hypothetical protein
VGREDFLENHQGKCSDSSYFHDQVDLRRSRSPRPLYVRVNFIKGKHSASVTPNPSESSYEISGIITTLQTTSNANSEADSQFASSKEFSNPSPSVSRQYKITRISPPPLSSDVELECGVQRPLLNVPNDRPKV